MKFSDLNGICTHEKQQHINEFADYCCDKLGIDRPKLTLKGTNDTNALGYTDMSDGSVTIVVADRHQMDIMRTLAHELVHCKQMTTHTPCGNTGSKDENEANAMAGVLMREWGQQNPDLFTEGVYVKEANTNQQSALYNPAGKTYRQQPMPHLDNEDPVNKAQGFDSFDDNEFAYDPETDQSIDNDKRNKKIANILRGLNPQEQEVMKMRFVDDMSLGKIGKVLNLSPERIRQIEQKALRKLRHPSRSDQLVPHTDNAEPFSVGEARFKFKKPPETAQDRLNKRAATHGIGTPDKEKFYTDMKKKFQSALDNKDPHGHKKAKPMDLSKGGSTKVKTYKTDEGQKCWPGYEKKGTKKMFGKTVNNCVKKESTETELEESKTARMMALITALGATYGLEDEARAFADQIKQNIHNAQTAEPNPGRPDPVTPGNMMPGSDRVMRPQLTKEQRLREIKKRQMMIRQKIQEISEAKKDACYNKVRSRYKVWPSAYASGALVQCRKKGAKNWGNKSKK